MINREAIVAVARSFVDTPVVHQGRKPGVGLDCGGLLACIPPRVPGLEVVHLKADYAKATLVGVRLYRLLRANTDEIPLTALQPGSIILWWMTRRRATKSVLPQHVGVWVGDGVVHAEDTVKRVVETSYGDYWREREYAAFDFRAAGAAAAHAVEERCKDCREGSPCGCD